MKRHAIMLLCALPMGGCTIGPASDYEISILPPKGGIVCTKHEWTTGSAPTSHGVAMAGVPFPLRLPGATRESVLFIIVIDNRGMTTSPPAYAGEPRHWTEVQDFDPNWLRASHGQVWTGMTEEQVLFAWGQPLKKRSPEGSLITVEMWDYPDPAADASRTVTLLFSKDRKVHGMRER
jgi:hypothetical protein